MTAPDPDIIEALFDRLAAIDTNSHTPHTTARSKSFRAVSR